MFQWLLLLLLWVSPSKAECPTGVTGLCDPGVTEVIEETVTEEVTQDSTGITTITTTVTDTTTTTVTNYFLGAFKEDLSFQNRYLRYINKN